MFSNINKGETTLGVFIDLKKAFDTVNTEILLKKLNEAGIRGNTLKWCHSYLTGRSQKTLANGVLSASLPITCGVPQGSVLGPLLFLVYINDLQQAVPNCKVKLYADDTVLYHSELAVDDVARALQTSLNRFSRWCKINKLTVNTKKTKVMTFGTRAKVKKGKNVKIYLDGDIIQRVPTFKYLGMVLDPTLNYNHHISSILRTVLHKMVLLAKLKKYLHNDVALQIYKSMLLPYFDYVDVIYHKSNSSDLEKIQRLQNRCLRVCMGFDRRYSVDRAHRIAETPFLRDRRRAHVLNFMYKRKDNQTLLNVREIRTRAHDAPLFNIQIPICEAFKRSVGYFGSDMWNSLSPAVRNTDSFLAFKTLQKKEMLLPLDRIEL